MKSIKLKGAVIFAYLRFWKIKVIGNRGYFKEVARRGAEDAGRTIACGKVYNY
jgi:hypothetical protein